MYTMMSMKVLKNRIGLQSYKTSPSTFNTVDEDRSSSGNNSILVINDVDYEIKDCGLCIECKDQKRFGGPGKRKKACLYREKKRSVKRF